MNDDRLTGLLGSLRTERMDRAADDRVRARLENAWTARRRERSWTFRFRRLAPVIATAILLAGLGTATLNASGDSVLYGARVTIENAAVALYPDRESRAEYLLALYDQRQAEAARLEATGNALAASRVRQLEQDTLRELDALIPTAPDENTTPVAAPSPTDTPSPAPTPTPLPTPSLTPAQSVTPRPTTPRPSATPTPTPRPPTPTPAPTGSPMPVTISGTVKNADGTLADGVCVMLQTGSGCLTTTTQGSYRFTISARLNQGVTLYFTRQDATVLWKGTVTGTVKSSTLTMSTVTLFK